MLPAAVSPAATTSTEAYVLDGTAHARATVGGCGEADSLRCEAAGLAHVGSARAADATIGCTRRAEGCILWPVNGVLALRARGGVGATNAVDWAAAELGGGRSGAAGIAACETMAAAAAAAAAVMQEPAQAP